MALILGAAAFIGCAPNNPPVISRLAAEELLVERLESTGLECVAADPDGDALTYVWTASGGTVSGNGSLANWTAPDIPGSYSIEVTVSDGRDGETPASIIIDVMANRLPVIMSLTADPLQLTEGDTSTITCKAADPDGDELSYRWAANGGDISGQGAVVNWAASGYTGSYTITVTVCDGDGGETSQSVTIDVLKGG